MSHRPPLARLGLVALWSAALTTAALLLPHPPPARAADDLQVEVAKKGLGKEVSIKQGAKEWFMMVEVTAENTVIVRQEIDNGAYLVDESETHDRAMTKEEVDAAIEAFINSVKTQAAKRK
jgi:H+/gluconate symporter-like permease